MKRNDIQKNYRINLLKKTLKDKGIILAFKEKVIPYFLRFFTGPIKRRRFLVAIFYGFFPKIKRAIFFYRGSGMIKWPRTGLMESVREFWYKNKAGDFLLDGDKITRKDIFVYGGPSAEFTCPICQKSEWLSRVRQKNLFISHSCKTSKRCKVLCERQGDELWTQFHQNFNFAVGCDSKLPAPKGIYVLLGSKKKFTVTRLEPMERILRRRFAYSCQLDVAERSDKINWSNYDFLFIYHPGCFEKFPRPNIPVILFCHDFWPLENKGYQWAIDWLKPDIILTSCPEPWIEKFRIPEKTRVVFSPMFPSFFERPNLKDKKIDLLAIGATVGPRYELRRKLNNQISQLVDRYRVELSSLVGNLAPNPEEPTEKESFFNGQRVRYLNKWSEYLAGAKYVIFGRMDYPILVGKYYETLGSGAIPIFPEISDLKYLEVKPFEHYIPLSEVENDNGKLTYFLDNYEKFKYIAENAVNWYKKNSDKMLFNDFENMIREVTGQRFPNHLI